jgi:hypothetical protein
MTPYTLRSACLICKSDKLVRVFDKDTTNPISMSLYDEPYDKPIFVPYNVVSCAVCNTYQTQYLGDLNLIYEKNHIDTFGSVKTQMHMKFKNFISKNSDITGILEIGPSTDMLAIDLLDFFNNSITYSVVDPDFRGDRTRVKVFDTFIEDVELNEVEGNTVVMSNLFEHLYNPMDIIDKIQRHSGNKYIYLNHPNFDHACKNDILVLLNIEHIFYVENDFVVKMFNNFGYSCVEKENYETHTIMFKFERTHSPIHLPIKNVSSNVDVQGHFERLKTRADTINKLLCDSSTKVYLWPASAHTTALFTYGVDHTKVAGLLDNSPTKIGKFFYGYNLECFSFRDTMSSCDENTTIILGGSDCYIKELIIASTKAKLIYLRNI